MDAETLTRRLAIDDDCGDFCSTIGNGSWCKILVDIWKINFMWWEA